eukprot:GHVN01086663.1.p1 GENE.GHVN01086663.1~~GHVN01086663.1.p1  ORF type:complete len:369 (+),score=86.62 GHVN01086663.1:33-1139(+)
MLPNALWHGLTRGCRFPFRLQPFASFASSSTSDYYKILGISENATERDIKKAYREKALKWHPDRNPDDKRAAQHEFCRVNEAFQTLSDKGKRSMYDSSRRGFGFGESGSGFRSGFGESGPNSSSSASSRSYPHTTTSFSMGEQQAPQMGFNARPLTPEEAADIFSQFFQFTRGGPLNSSGFPFTQMNSPISSQRPPSFMDLNSLFSEFQTTQHTQRTVNQNNGTRIERMGRSPDGSTFHHVVFTNYNDPQEAQKGQKTINHTFADTGTTATQRPEWLNFHPLSGSTSTSSHPYDRQPHSSHQPNSPNQPHSHHQPNSPHQPLLTSRIASIATHFAVTFVRRFVISLTTSLMRSLLKALEWLISTGGKR